MHRSLKPAKHAAQTLLRHRADAQACAAAAPVPGQRPWPQQLEVLHACGFEPGAPGPSAGAESSGRMTEQEQEQAAEQQGNGEADSRARSGGIGSGQVLESYPLPESPNQPAQRGGIASSSAAYSDDGQGMAARRITLEIDGGRQPGQATIANVSGGFAAQPGMAWAAGDDVRWRQPRQGLPPAAEGYGVAAMLRVTDAEWHSRIEQDWYAATVAVDLFAFVYVALFYQARPARRLQLCHRRKPGSLRGGFAS